MEQLTRSEEFGSKLKTLQLPTFPLITDHNNTNYLGLDERNIDPTFSGWLGSYFSKNKKSKEVQYTFWNLFSKPNTWISSDNSERTKIKRKAYEALSQLDENYTVTIKVPAQNNQPGQQIQFVDQEISVKALLTALSNNSIETIRSTWNSSTNPDVNKLITDLQQEDRRVFNEFERTLSDAAPNGMVGTFIQGRRNPHLAHILSMFTLLYAKSPEQNPLIHNAKMEQNPGDFLRRHRGNEQRWEVLDRRAVEGYIAKIQAEITKLINMPAEAFEMAFPEDNIKHQTVIKVLKRAFNRLAAEIDYEFRFENERKAFGLEILQGDVKRDAKVGTIVFDNTQFSFVNSNGSVINEFHNLKVVDENHEDYPDFKKELLKKAAKKGYKYHEKSNDYVKADTQRKTDEDHKKLQSKLSMRNLKKGLFWTAAVFAIIIAAGQVAIAVFAATGSLAVAIGISCAVTNTVLFWRDIAGVLIALARGDLTYGMSWPLKVFLGVFFSFSLATGIISGGFAFSALVALTGFTVATAPTIALIGTGFIAALTIVGMTSLFFMVGVGFAKGLRGKTFSQVRSESWASFKGFFKFPEYNHELRKLQNEVINLMTQNNNDKFTSAVRNEILQKRKQIALLKFEHNLRHILKVIFAVPLVIAALIGTFIAAFAISKSSVDGTANLIQLALKWSDTASLAVAAALSWVPGFAVNFGLTLKNLTNVSLLIGAKVAQVTAGVVYGVGMFGVILTSGRFFRTIMDSAKFYWNYPTKEVLLPSGRIILALGVLVLVVLNGYGNGATLGQQGAFSLEWLPNRALSWLESMAPATMAALKANFGFVTTVVGNASSDALNAGACRDTAMEYSLVSAPVLHLNGQETNHKEMARNFEERETPKGPTFFAQSCTDYDAQHAAHLKTLAPKEDESKPLLNLD